MTKKPGASFYSTLMPLVKVINKALQGAYDHACETQRLSVPPPAGSSLQHRELFQMSSDYSRCLGHGARVVNTQKQIFQIGEYFLECRSVSPISGANIMNCFPSKDQPLSVCEEQIPLWDDDESIENERNLVLAHMGNAREGFTSAHLCIRKYVGKKLSWAFTEEIFSVEDSSTATVPTIANKAALWSVPAPEAKKIPKPGVVRKKKPDSKNPEE